MFVVFIPNAFEIRRHQFTDDSISR